MSPGIVDRDVAVLVNQETPPIRENGVAKAVLPADRARRAEFGGPPRGAFAVRRNTTVNLARAGCGVHSDVGRQLAAIASSLALRPSLHMSPIMVIPPDHCDMPPNSGWLNCAMAPPLAFSARSTALIASSEIAWRDASLAINRASDSVAAMNISPTAT